MLVDFRSGGLDDVAIVSQADMIIARRVGQLIGHPAARRNEHGHAGRQQLDQHARASSGIALAVIEQQADVGVERLAAEFVAAGWLLEQRDLTGRHSFQLGGRVDDVSFLSVSRQPEAEI